MNRENSLIGKGAVAFGKGVQGLYILCQLFLNAAALFCCVKGRWKKRIGKIKNTRIIEMEEM